MLSTVIVSRLHDAKFDCTDMQSQPNNCVITWSALCYRVPHFTGPCHLSTMLQSCCGFQSHAGSLEHNRQSVGSGGTCRLIKENTAPPCGHQWPITKPQLTDLEQQHPGEDSPPSSREDPHSRISRFPGFQDSPSRLGPGHAPTRCCRTVTR